MKRIRFIIFISLALAFSGCKSIPSSDYSGPHQKPTFTLDDLDKLKRGQSFKEALALMGNGYDIRWNYKKDREKEYQGKTVLVDQFLFYLYYNTPIKEENQNYFREQVAVGLFFYKDKLQFYSIQHRFQDNNGNFTSGNLDNFNEYWPDSLGFYPDQPCDEEFYRHFNAGRKIDWAVICQKGCEQIEKIKKTDACEVSGVNAVRKIGDYNIFYNGLYKRWIKQGRCHGPDDCGPLYGPDKEYLKTPKQTDAVEKESPDPAEEPEHTPDKEEEEN